VRGASVPGNTLQEEAAMATDEQEFEGPRDDEGSTAVVELDATIVMTEEQLAELRSSFDREDDRRPTERALRVATLAGFPAPESGR
jgi:hypothetical protein